MAGILYESHVGVVMSKVIEEMRTQTLKEAMLDVAKRMLEDGVLACKKIAEYTGLSVEEVENLKGSMTI